VLEHSPDRAAAYGDRGAPFAVGYMGRLCLFSPLQYMIRNGIKVFLQAEVTLFKSVDF